MSSNPYARRPLFPMPISVSVTVCPSLASAVVRGFDGHLDVVRVRLLQTGGRDPDELPLLLQLGDRGGTDVVHGLPEAADELVRDRRQWAAVGHLPLDALGDQL